MVKFYSPSCGHCVKMEPDYLKAAKQMLGVVPFISINCPDNNALCQKNNVKGK